MNPLRLDYRCRFCKQTDVRRRGRPDRFHFCLHSLVQIVDSTDALVQGGDDVAHPPSWKEWTEDTRYTDLLLLPIDVFPCRVGAIPF